MSEGDPRSAPLVVERGRWWTVANGLTFVRLLLVPVCAAAVLGGRVEFAFGAFWIAVVTDYVDGPIARRRGEASALGGLLDHSSDAIFVSVGIAALACRELAPVALAPMIALAFVQYAIDSNALAGHRLRTSTIGRTNGVAYFVLLGTPITRDMLGLTWPSDGIVMVLGWVLVATTAASMLERAWLWLRLRRG